MYARPPASAPIYYYGVYYVTVPFSGSYMLTSESNVYTIGYLYNGRFRPAFPEENLLALDDSSADNGQFQINAFLQAHFAYILVVSTLEERTIADYTVVVSGLTNVDIVQNNTTIGKHV